MAMRAKVVSLVQQTMEHPFECITEISKYAIHNYTAGVPYSHIWTSYVASKAGLGVSQVPLTASCDRGVNWFRKRKRYKLGQAYGGDYVPCPGDYIYCSSTYEQADATDVGIVLDSNGTFVKFVHWEEGSPQVAEWYNHNQLIIGYGVPEYEDVSNVEIPAMATKGDAVAIVGEEVYIHTSPDGQTARIGTLKKGHAVEVLGITPTGWLQVVWGLSKTGYAYIDNGKLLHKVLKDETPYMKFEGFKIGDKVQFKGGKVFKQANKNSKSKTVNPFVGKITGANNMYHLEDVNGKIKGWVCKTDVDFIPDLGYNKREGMVNTNQAYLRVGPGREFTKVQKWPQMVKGSIVDVLGVTVDNDNNEWYHVVIEGVKGYIEDYCISDIEA